MLEDLPSQYRNLVGMEVKTVRETDDCQIHASSFVGSVVHTFDEYVQVLSTFLCIRS